MTNTIMASLWQTCTTFMEAQPLTYRQPILGAVPLDNPRVKRWLEAHSEQVKPDECLPGARSIVAFFVPFSKEMAFANRTASYPTEAWAEDYVRTNKLLAETTTAMIDQLAHMGVRAMTAKPTHNFDEKTLLSFWSHKHMAWACGLGEFGRHHMVITPAGVAGRFASLIVDCVLNDGPGIWDPQKEAFGPPAPKLCREDAGCRACERSCPTGALTTRPFDRHKCYDFLLEVDRTYHHLPLSDVCGFCACAGPCAVIENR
ncbi:epoxyqueuosine reductase [Heliobacterium chlorum]|uniref:Epoxyqueuosine reductase n=1 Tax=Heliobacterium chlorum TaxID=2698 RepID=A0ABR7SWM7_HELCL|nr:epoxyqueuosine reductase [Heliobacterium chlorum]MBC9782959.1 epoxyqueuosine reductase [Heliobacterium chlorum]